ncbi:MAG: translesion error-prone DNA polymerase V autoproteolytic subunit [Candidatus Glassbacteria bacterium]|nr:translesion error-prone DNA polymerase V autoproteolytic subunit [Candidatus Glassbacteria bacterium]
MKTYRVPVTLRRLALDSFPYVAQGWPSPAEDFQERSLDLNEHLIRHPAATFFVRAEGHSMIGAGIHDGDLLIVDKALEPNHGDIVIAVIDGEFTCKQLILTGGSGSLVAANPDYPPIKIPPDGCGIWGVVAHVIHSPRG